MQPYRSDLDALEARHAALEVEVNDRVRQRDEAARMLHEARARQRDADRAADHAAGGPDRRRRRTLILIAAGLAVVAGFIAMGRVSSRGNDRDAFYRRVMVQFEKFVDEACECKDSACVTAITERMTKWGNELQHEIEPDHAKFDESMMKKAQVLSERMTSCVSKAMTPTAYESQEGGLNAERAGE
ncbi:MAG: hypothetical protein M4D80_30345 [Myxococcota bacterium]|nr:hypothetical protein [Deltaproteobacteria bacterium]MDQ3339486.1 hypothetical protein [Myxococcota bacterium]